MASTISAGTTSGTAIAIAGDTSGVLALQSNSTTFATGNQYGIGLGTAVPSSGIGLAFPANQSASTDANTLDDYEEGTWTATYIAGDNITGTPTLSQGRYTKIGNIVNVSGKITATVTSSNIFTYTIFPLPFTPAYITTGSAVSNSNVRVGTLQLTAAGNMTTYFPAASAIVSGSEIFYVNATYQV